MRRVGSLIAAVIALAVVPSLVGALAWAGQSSAAVPSVKQARTQSLPPCPSWSLWRDFGVAPDQANPNPDRCGNPAVWSFLQGQTRRSTYTLLGEFIPNAFDVQGLEQWQGTNVSGGPTDKLPAVGINRTGADATVLGILWQSRRIRVHPLDRDLVIVGWRSPLTARVRFSARFRDLDVGCSDADGVNVAVRHGDTVLGQAAFPQGGQRRLTGTVAVRKRSFLYFIVGDGGHGNFGCDSTGLSVNIEPVG